MPKYTVSTYATRKGSVHMNHGEHRYYAVEADSVEDARFMAIDAAYAEGGLEHVSPRNVVLYKPEEHHHTKHDGSWWEYDARGIELARVCKVCKPHKLAKYRPDVLTNPNYTADEPFEED